jgi:hypothetical protein
MPLNLGARNLRSELGIARWVRPLGAQTLAHALGDDDGG